MGLNSCLKGLLPFAAMVMVECLDVGLTTLSKAAMSKGMSHFVFVVYSNALATLILFPFSFIFNSTQSPPLTLSLLCKFFLLGLIGITVMQNCVFTGVSYSSPTLASAMSNLIPAFTFLLSVIFRMEKLDLRSLRSLIKVLGTLVSISGALIVTLYKGPSIDFSSNEFIPITLKVSSSSAFESSHIFGASSNWVLGGLFLATAGLSFSIWNISQAAILKGFPSEITVVFFYCLFGTIQSAVVALIVEGDPAVWKVKLDIELAAIIYSALFGSVVTYNAQTWCIHKKGPVFTAMFKPLGIAIAALLGAFFLGDTLHVGSILGAAIIVSGFYAVMWSQSKEKNSNGDIQALQKPFLESREISPAACSRTENAHLDIQR
ncbi:hypothetical protein Nepgr_003139 [Nepenthes gracilis]|uniref:WAT1-related protein n=1 Tax=Nepenthes gracilis TaxID=150966 RepID=A0AAD3RZ21_NEPGR|nr:hypothetical protein Nepgr_003139 [Nepenthes gracilis]